MEDSGLDEEELGLAWTSPRASMSELGPLRVSSRDMSHLWPAGWARECRPWRKNLTDMVENSGLDEEEVGLDQEDKLG